MSEHDAALITGFLRAITRDNVIVTAHGNRQNGTWSVIITTPCKESQLTIQSARAAFTWKDKKDQETTHS